MFPSKGSLTISVESVLPENARTTSDTSTRLLVSARLLDVWTTAQFSLSLFLPEFQKWLLFSVAALPIFHAPTKRTPSSVRRAVSYTSVVHHSPWLKAATMTIFSRHVPLSFTPSLALTHER